jgi:hypothetical protein
VEEPSVAISIRRYGGVCFSCSPIVRARVSSTSHGAWVTTRRDTLPNSCSEVANPTLPITISSASFSSAAMRIASPGASADIATSWRAPSRSAISSARATASLARSGFW